MPSKQFDLLAVDFDHTLISAVVIGMAAVTYVLSKVATRKMLKSQWKWTNCLVIIIIINANIQSACMDHLEYRLFLHLKRVI